MSRRKKSGQARGRQSSGYKKPQTVDAGEKAGSAYRKKLRNRKSGTGGDQTSADDFGHAAETQWRGSLWDMTPGVWDLDPCIETPEDVEARIGRSSSPAHRAFNSQTDRRTPGLVLMTQRFRGPGARNTEIAFSFYEKFTIPAVEDPGLRFKPCFLVAEKRAERDGDEYWTLSRWIGATNKDGDFLGRKDVIAENIDIYANDIASGLAEWAGKFDRKEFVSEPHSLLPEAKLVYPRQAARRFDRRLNW